MVLLEKTIGFTLRNFYGKMEEITISLKEK